MIFLQTSTTELNIRLLGYWPMLLAAVLAMAAVYLLLPRPKPFPVLYGVFSGFLALVIVALRLIQPEKIFVETILFCAFAGLALVAGAVMITQTQPVRAALSFAMVVLSTCGLFLLQAAPFLTAATAIVYAGAIVVTFLFVIMLAQQSGASDADYRSREPLLACVAGFVLLAAMLCVLGESYDSRAQSQMAVELESLLRNVDEARRAHSIEKMKKLLLLAENDKAARRQNVLKQIQKKAEKVEKNSTTAALLADKLKTACDDADSAWWIPNEPDIRLSLTKVSEHGVRLINLLRGTLQPDAELNLTPFSGVPANRSPSVDATGRARMPADNVSALARTLFTDYLIPVELAATLLLVATIGAIAIAGRKSDKLR